MDDIEDARRAIGPFIVQRRQYATCIYRPDSPLDLEELEAAVRDERVGFKTFRVCHQSHEACCRRFWDQHKGEFPVGQIAQRLGMVAFVDDNSRTISEERDE